MKQVDYTRKTVVGDLHEQSDRTHGANAKKRAPPYTTTRRGGGIGRKVKNKKALFHVKQSPPRESAKQTLAPRKVQEKSAAQNKPKASLLPREGQRKESGYVWLEGVKIANISKVRAKESV